MSDQGTGSVAGQPQTLDLTKHGQMLVPLKGFDKPVPLEQVVSGFMRQSDYTNKTQQLAVQQRELDSKQDRFDKMDQWFTALDSDPVGTFRQMQRAWNISPDSISVDGEIDEDFDPKVASLQAEITGLKNMLEQNAQTSQQTAAMQELREAFPDLAVEDVTAYASANNMDQSRLLDAAKLMSYDRISEEQAMNAQAEQQRQAQLDAVVGAKQGLPPISSGAAPTPSPDLLPTMEPELPSFEEAVQLAQVEHGQATF